MQRARDWRSTRMYLASFWNNTIQTHQRIFSLKTRLLLKLRLLWLQARTPRYGHPLSGNIVSRISQANTLTFALLELAKAQGLQEKLRAEIHSTVGGARAGSVAYDTMPLLNAVIKESLRLYPAEPISERIVVQDTVIPLAHSITAAKGERVSHIPVRKGQIMTLAIASYQRLESHWGEDADEFNPSRWLDGGAYKGEAVGPYANLLSFLAGPRICLGWRFVILEMQVFLCELVGKFSFALPADGPARTRWAATLLPIMCNGQKGAHLGIERIA